LKTSADLSSTPGDKNAKVKIKVAIATKL